MFEALLLWLGQERDLLAVVGIASIMLLLVTILATPWLVAQLPADYFAIQHQDSTRSVIRWFVALLRSIVGLMFFLLGLLMIITPGPGLVCMVLGLAISDFPGKHSLLTWFVSQPRVFNGLNWIRQRTRSAPFIHPE